MAKEKSTAEKSENKKALSAGLGYTIGNLLVNGIAFVSVPIFTRLMSTSDYGIYSSFMTYQAILSIIIGLSLHVSIKNAKYDYSQDLQGYNASVLTLMLISSFVIAVIALIFQGILSQWLYLDWFLILPLVIYSACSALLMLYNSALVLEYRYKEYLAISLFYSVGSIILSVILILTCFTGLRYLGRILGGFIPMAVVGLIICIAFFRKSRPKINKEYWKYGLKISLPIVPHGLSQLILTQFDRIMILRMIGSAASGIYSFAYTMAMILQIVYTSLDSVWTTWFFEMMSRGQRKEIKNKSRIYVVIISLITIMFFLVVPEIIEVFSSKPYWDAKYVVIPVGLALYFSFLYFFPAGVEYYYKKTIYIAVGTTAAAAINVVLNLLFIPRFGYVIAAYTTLASYILYFIFHLIIAYRLEKDFVFDIRAILVSLVFTAGAGALSMALMELPVLRWLIFVLLLGCLAAVVYKKRESVKEIMGRKN